MARPTSANQQQAANSLPSVDDIFRVYILSRLQAKKYRKIEILLNFSSLRSNLQKGIRISSEEQKNCLQTLNTLNLENPLGYSKLFRLCDLMAGTFENGEINWTKIFFVLDSVVNMILRNGRNVFLVDQLCHYCETVHLSSTEQTLSEWIAQVSKEVKITEDLEKSSLTASDKKINESGPIEVAWVDNCPCGAEPDWSIKDCRKCNRCGKYPCAIDGCTRTFTRIFNAEAHVKQAHTREEQFSFEKLLQRYRVQYCRCGERIPRGGDLQYVKCPKCGTYKCLRGECTSFAAASYKMADHQRHHCKFRPASNPLLCTNCGGQKPQSRTFIQQCPNPNCQLSWCPYCTFEGINDMSVGSHIGKIHRYAR